MPHPQRSYEVTIEIHYNKPDGEESKNRDCFFDFEAYGNDTYRLARFS